MRRQRIEWKRDLLLVRCKGAANGRAISFEKPRHLGGDLFAVLHGELDGSAGMRVLVGAAADTDQSHGARVVALHTFHRGTGPIAMDFIKAEGRGVARVVGEHGPQFAGRTVHEHYRERMIHGPTPGGTAVARKSGTADRPRN